MLLKIRSYVCCSPSAGRLISIRTVSPTTLDAVSPLTGADVAFDIAGGARTTFFETGLSAGFWLLVAATFGAGKSP